MTESSNVNEETQLEQAPLANSLTSPGLMRAEYPCGHHVKQFIATKRREISDIIHGRDDRLLVVIGPCSIHDVDQANEYAQKLSVVAKTFASTLLIVMRVYCEKPRTTIGWKGLIYDPHLDGSNDIDHGLRITRQLLLDINELGLPCASEILQPVIVHYLSDLISWVAIGARTTESQIHRELVSGLDIPTGFKNGSTGSVETAVNACVASQMAQALFTVSHFGNFVAYTSSGNGDVHVVLRGGTLTGPNYSSKHVSQTQKLLNMSEVKSRIMIDCSHGNSMKDGESQKHAIGDVCQQVACGSESIMGVMIESHLFGGRQTLVEGKKHLLQFGVSITDSCLGWDASVSQLQLLSEAVTQRRKRKHGLGTPLAQKEFVDRTNGFH